jgi:DNA helicase-2/ATP-dependent DNA helicase PcrA
MAGAEPERLLAGLTASQRAAVTSEAGLLAVIAGAGSGKTTVLTRRIAWRVAQGSADPEHLLVVTFTRKAAGELRSRLGRLGTPGSIRAGTFHATAYAELRRHWADTGRRAPGLVPDPRPLLRELAGQVGDLPAGVAAGLPAELAWARARMLGGDGYVSAAVAERRLGPVAAERVGSVLARYEQEKRRRRLIDLDDLIEQFAALLEAGGLAAEAVRWRLRHLFVDEFQDVNPAQWRLLEALRNGRPDLCVVGDPRQAVYAWNGADPTLLGRLPELLPGIATVALDENHRCAPEIVRAAAAVLGTPCPTTRRPPGDEPVLCGFDTEEAEAAGVARWARLTRRPGRPWRHLAVLARTNARLEPVAEALRRAGIPYRLAGSRRPSGDVAEALQALSALPRRAPLRSALVEVADGDELLDLADEHAADEPTPTVGTFLSWLSVERGAGDVEPGVPADEDAVTLATFHRAKGLEWPAVAVVGLEQGMVPIAYAQTAVARAEERRLLYVAMTRAEESLWCSWAASDASTTRSRRGASPFLDPVRRALAESARPAMAGPEAVDRVAELRARLPALR